MSHATALVVIPDAKLGNDIDLESALDAILAPYYEYLDTDPDDGEEYNTENAKWDWYVIGGRWSGNVINTTHTVHHEADPNFPPSDWNSPWDEKTGGVNIIRKKDLVNIIPTLAFVDAEGTWYERGELGWFGVVHNEKDPDLWESAFHQLLAKVDDNDWLVLVDYHI